jgi:peptidoglycan/xylan/chitin deacetylase (PgdA/CDA1 family)
VSANRWLRWLLSAAPRRAPQGPRLIVIRHHRIYSDGERPLYRLGVEAHVFEAQLRTLRDADLAPLSVATGLTWLAGAGEGVRVAMSFDDGYADNVSVALPRLLEYGARATFYLTAGLIEERVSPWWDRLAHRLAHARAGEFEWTVDGRHIRAPLTGEGAQRAALAALLPAFHAAPEIQERRLQELARLTRAEGEPQCALATWNEARGFLEEGIEIGAHTLSHPFLSRLSPERQESEIGGSIDMIEQRLGVRPLGFAYPGGDYDAASIAACSRHRLRYAVTTRRGDVTSASAAFELSRRGLSEGACLDPFGRYSPSMARAELAGAFDSLRRAAEAST